MMPLRRPRVLALLALFALLALEAAVVWRPFEARAVLYQTPWRSNQPAGELVAGVRIAQEIRGNLVRTRPVKAKSVHWHSLQSLKPLLEPNCFALLFATYSRTNTARLRVDWRQGATMQSWDVVSHDLADNTYVDFCPDAGIAINRDFRIAIRGLDGKPGFSPTLWLVQSKLAPARVGSDTIGQRSLAVQLLRLQKVGMRDIATVGGGAFLVACLCSLAIVLLLLARGMHEYVTKDPSPVKDG
jgi:hypothetical protein